MHGWGPGAHIVADGTWQELSAIQCNEHSQVLDALFTCILSSNHLVVHMLGCGQWKVRLGIAVRLNVGRPGKQLQESKRHIHLVTITCGRSAIGFHVSVACANQHHLSHSRCPTDGLLSGSRGLAHQHLQARWAVPLLAHLLQISNGQAADPHEQPLHQNAIHKSPMQLAALSILCGPQLPFSI